MRTVVVAAVVGVLGAIGIAIGMIVEPARAFAAYLAAWTTVGTVAVGGLAMLLIGYAANAKWPAAIRRPSEAVALGVTPIALLAIPLLVWPEHVWPWVHPSAADAHAVTVKQAYLALPFFTARTVVYLGVFVVAAELLRRWSRRRDVTPTPTLDRERTFSSAMLPLVGLALTFGAFDWLMSLQPDWWSSGFGLYVICGALLSGLAMIAVLAWRGTARGELPLTGPHFHAIGRLLHAYVILWTYIAYFQAMLIQIANRPSEARFYVERSHDGWRIVTALVLILLFALPFPLLFPRRLKRRPRYVAGVAILLLAGHYLDFWWLVVPRVSKAPVPSWTDLAAICAVAGLTTAACALRLRGSPPLPVGDPHLAAGLAYETTT
ncbi:MAG: hypothetical protein JO257_04555 [Deltaproteobacteria bacterium]|nr:hypothetical protein [Deltaproteobacteria bacterium]